MPATTDIDEPQQKDDFGFTPEPQDFGFIAETPKLAADTPDTAPFGGRGVTSEPVAREVEETTFEGHPVMRAAEPEHIGTRALRAFRESLTPLIGPTEEQVSREGLPNPVTGKMEYKPIGGEGIEQKGFFPAVTEATSKPLVTLPELQADDPRLDAVLTGTLGRPPSEAEKALLAGTWNATKGFGEFFTSPMGAATGLSGGAPSWVKRAISGLYALDIAKNTPAAAERLGTATVTGTPQEKVESAIGLGTTIGLPALLGSHTLAPPPTPAEVLAMHLRQQTGAAPMPGDVFQVSPRGIPAETGELPAPRPTLPPEPISKAPEPTKTEVSDAGEVSPNAKVYGDVRAQPIEGEGKVPEQESSAGVQPQAAGGLPEGAQGDVLLSKPAVEQVRMNPVDAHSFSEWARGKTVSELRQLRDDHEADPMEKSDHAIEIINQVIAEKSKSGSVRFVPAGSETSTASSDVLLTPDSSPVMKRLTDPAEFKGNWTANALKYGAELDPAKPGQLAELKSLEKQYADELRAIPKTIENFPQISQVGYRKQWVTEAIQAAEGRVEPEVRNKYIGEGKRAPFEVKPEEPTTPKETDETEKEKAQEGVLSPKEQPTTAEPDDLTPDKSWFDKFKAADDALRVVQEKLAEAQRAYDRESYRRGGSSAEARMGRMRRMDAAREQLAKAQAEVDAAHEARMKARTSRDVEAYDYDHFIKQGKPLPPDREELYQRGAKPKTETPTPKTLSDLLTATKASKPLFAERRQIRRMLETLDRQQEQGVGFPHDDLKKVLQARLAEVEKKLMYAETGKAPVQAPTDAKGRTAEEQRAMDERAAQAKKNLGQGPVLPPKAPEPPTPPVAPAASPEVTGKGGSRTLAPGTVKTSADVQGALDELPEGQKWSPKVAKAQKQFLMDAVDQALADAPDATPATAHDADLSAVGEVKQFVSGEDRAKYEARRDAVVKPLFEKYGIPEDYPAREAIPSLDPELPAEKAEPAGEYSTDSRIGMLENAIERARFEALPKVTIDVPGDGTYDVVNSKAALTKFKEDHAANFPTTAPRPPVGKAATPRTTPTQPAPLGKADKASVLTALDPVRSTDETRYKINFLWSDGKKTVATNGSMLTVINVGIGGTVKNPKVFNVDGTEAKLPKGDKFPNFQQVMPPDMKVSVPAVPIDKLFELVKQAELMTTDRAVSILLWQNKDGTLGVTAPNSEVGSYENNVDRDTSKVLAAFNPEYLMNALNAARRMGDQTVTMEFTDELSPAKITSQHTMSVVMPMRLSFGGRKGGVFADWPKHTVADEAEVLALGGGKPRHNTNTTPVATTPAQVASLVQSKTPGLAGTLRQIVQGLLQPLLPSARSGLHLREAERLGAFLGAMHHSQEATSAQLKGASNYFDKLGVHNEQLRPNQNPGIQFMSDMSQGRALTGEAAVAKLQIEKMFQQRLKQLESAGAPLEKVRENYFPGMWTRDSRRAFNAALEEAMQSGAFPRGKDLNLATPQQRAAIKARVDQMMEAGIGSDVDMLPYLTKRPLKGRESFRKPKVFDDIMDAAEFGLRPVSNNPIDLVKGKLAEMDRSIMANREFQSLKGDGRLKVINPYEDVPPGWVKVNDKYGVIYGPPTTKLSEHVDKNLVEGLEAFARSLGVEHRRLTRFPPGPGSRALGLSYQGQNLILSRFASELSVIAHELGHQLDHRYDLWTAIVKDAQGLGAKGKPTKAASRTARVEIGKELTALADLTGRSKDYARSKVEKIAQMVEAYVGATEQMKSVAPKTYAAFDKFIKARPELAKLAEVKPGIELTERTGEKYVGLPILGYRIVPSEVSDILNNYLSSSLYNNAYYGPLYKGWMGAANALNQSQLGMGSAFHAGFTTADVQISAGADLYRDIYGIARGNRTVPQLARTAGRWVVATVRTGMTGDKVLNAWRNPDGVIDPKIAQVVRAAELAGGGFKMEAGSFTAQSQKMVRDWYAGHQGRAVLRSPVAATEALAKPIMEYLVPRQKAGVFAELAWRIIEQNPGVPLRDLTPQFRQAWNRVDARLGQVRYDRLFMNNAAKNVVQGLVRAPGWTGGTIAEIGGAFPDAVNFFKEWAKTGKAPQELPDRVAYTLSLLTTVAVVNAGLTYALSGKKPEGLDYLAFWDGTYDDRGNKRRWLLPTYMKDVLAYAIRADTTIMNKTHPALSVLNDVLIKNKDYYGYEIRDPHASALTQAGQAGKYVLKSFEPFWIRGAQQATQKQTTPAEIVAPYFGVMPAPRYITMSAMQRQISDLYHLRTGEPVKPYAKQFAPTKSAAAQRTLDIYQFNRLPQTDKDALKKKMTPEERRRYL